jgi:hypothetical protein
MLLGGYTTFSSFEYETYQSVREGARWSGALNVIVSVVLGYFGVWRGNPGQIAEMCKLVSDPKYWSGRHILFAPLRIDAYTRMVG